MIRPRRSAHAASHTTPRVSAPPRARHARQRRPAVLLLLLASPADADSITLLSRATVPPGRDITLADVSVLDGSSAAALRDLVLVPASEIDRSAAWLSVDIGRIRDAIAPLDAHTRAVLDISGRACVVRVASPLGPSPTLDAPIDSPPPPPPSNTVRAHVEATLLDHFKVPAADLRLEFEDRDADLLALSTVGRLVHARIAGLSSRVPVVVTVYEGEAIATSGAVRVTVHVRRDVAVAACPIRRAETITPDMLRSERRWLPADAQPATTDQLIGAVARRSIDADEPIDTANAQPPITIHRGDVVVVHCVLGSIVIEERARARDAARDGDVLELESIDGARRRFLARASGPGRAVLVEDPIPQEPTR